MRTSIPLVGAVLTLQLPAAASAAKGQSGIHACSLVTEGDEAFIELAKLAAARLR